jgi:hypothetical protein
MNRILFLRKLNALHDIAPLWLSKYSKTRLLRAVVHNCGTAAHFGALATLRLPPISEIRVYFNSKL